MTGDVVDRLDETFAQSLDDQPRAYLKAFREFAALDEIDLAPPAATDLEPATIFPEGDAAGVLLADIDGIHDRSDRGWIVGRAKADHRRPGAALARRHGHDPGAAERTAISATTHLLRTGHPARRLPRSE